MNSKWRTDWKLRDRSSGDGCIYGWLLIILLVCLVSTSLILDRAACRARWQHSGKASDWGPIQGCLVEVEPGRWIPDDRLREIDP